MNLEEIKAGETYNVRVLVSLIEPNRIVCRPLNQDGTPSAFCPNYFNFAEAEAFYPADGIKSAKNAQKYDPCRKFREGDIVTPCSVKGRWLGAAWKDRSGIRFTVTTDEDEDCTMWVKDPDSIQQDCVDVVYFQLVVPVEELEPYEVVETTDYWSVEKGSDEFCLFWKNRHPNAKAAAEAECARLNAEWRKEQDNALQG